MLFVSSNTILHPIFPFMFYLLLYPQELCFTLYNFWKRTSFKWTWGRSGIHQSILEHLDLNLISSLVTFIKKLLSYTAIIHSQQCLLVWHLRHDPQMSQKVLLSNLSIGPFIFTSGYVLIKSCNEILHRWWMMMYQ